MAEAPEIDRHAIAAALEAPEDPPSPVSPRRPRRSMGWMLAVALLGLSLVYAWFRGGESAANLDAHLLVVLPFEVVATDPAVLGWRERMPSLFAAELAADGSIQTTNPEVTLAAWRLRGGSDGFDLPMASALALAEDMGAGRLLLGTLVGEPSLVLMTTTLVNVPGGHVVREGYVEGPVDSITALVGRLATQIQSRW